MKDIYVTDPAMPEFDEYVEEIRSIWETRHITNFGPKYHELIERIKERFGYEHVDIQCNGHMTLHNILSCLPPGEIITTPFTFISTTLAILNSGHTPVFCDIKMSDYNIDPDLIEDLITEKTVAIVPVHVFGTPCDVDRIQEIADRHGLKVVYDAAHAFNVSVDGTEIGKFGDASMFSFHATKVFNSIEGGMGVFKDEAMRKECSERSNFGIKDSLTCYNGINSKMNEFSAAMGLVNLRYLDGNIEKRKALTARYDSNLEELKQLKRLERKSNVRSNYAYYPVVIDSDCGVSAQDLMDRLQEHNVYGRRYFYPSSDRMPVFKEFRCDCPNAHIISDHIVCLPIAASMTIEEIDFISGIVKELFT